MLRYALGERGLVKERMTALRRADGHTVRLLRGRRPRRMVRLAARRGANGTPKEAGTNRNQQQHTSSGRGVPKDHAPHRPASLFGRWHDVKAAGTLRCDYPVWTDEARGRPGTSYGDARERPKSSGNGAIVAT